MPAFLTTVRRHRDEVCRRIGDGVQTNEVGRSAVLVGGYAVVAERTALPLRVLELGASAGLNLRWDAYAYDTGRVVAGDPDSPVRFERVWEGDAAGPPGPLRRRQPPGMRPQPGRPHERRRPAPLSCPTCGPTRLLRLAAARRRHRDRPARAGRGRPGRGGRVGQPMSCGSRSRAWPRSSPTRSSSSTCERRLVQRLDRRHRGGRRAGHRRAPLAWLRMEPSTSERAEAAAHDLARGGGAAARNVPATTATRSGGTTRAEAPRYPAGTTSLRPQSGDEARAGRSRRRGTPGRRGRRSSSGSRSARCTSG